MMKATFERYDVYKDSGVEWLGDIPSQWDVKRLKDIGISIIGITYSPEDVLNDEVGGVLVLRSSNIQDNKLSLLDTVHVRIKVSRKQTLKKGDILLCSRNGSRALIGKNICIDERTEGQTFGAFMTIYRSKYFRFIHNFLNSKLFEAQSGLYMSSTINQLTINTLNNFLIALPQPSEQKAIADYLDVKNAQIDRKIDLLTQKATQYGKLKKSLINENVTRGLDKTVTMKDSGVEWIGEVPEHWGISKLSQSFSQIGSGTTPKSGIDAYYEGGTINWINTGDLNDGILSSCKRAVTEKALKDYALNVYPAGSIIIAMYGATIGKVSILMIEACTNQACCVLNKSKEIDIKFLLYWFISKREFIISLSYGGGQPNISQDTIKGLRVILPPLPEQKAIANYLDTKTAQIDRIVEAIYIQIDKLKELRKTLINDVVTGKIKIAVRGETV